MTHRIEVIPYDTSWPGLFEVESEKIKKNLREVCIAVHHVGSTSVPGLCAKPKIDIILVVKDLMVTPALEKMGYKCKGEINIPFHHYCTKRSSFPGINLHVYEEDNSEIESNIMFRDFLRNQPELRDEYAALKTNLVTQEELHKKNNSKFSGYALGKDAFIKKVLEQSGFNNLCMRFCAHYDEWKAARNFRQKYFFDKVPIADPYTWTFDHSDHVHLVFYQGINIIGYTHIQLLQEQKAALRIFVIDDPLRDKKLARYFLELCEKWLKQKGLKKTQTQPFLDDH